MGELLMTMLGIFLFLVLLFLILIASILVASAIKTIISVGKGE